MTPAGDERDSQSAVLLAGIAIILIGTWCFLVAEGALGFAVDLVIAVQR